MEGAVIRKSEIKIEKELNISTRKINESMVTDRYNRYEPTPYRALEVIVKNLKLKKSDKVVDFGAGRGRVLFYLHYHFGAKMLGIEFHDNTFDEALNNLHSYSRVRENALNDITFSFEKSENYLIKDDDNYFFLFNPFSHKVFREVLGNIENSLDKKYRDSTIVLYYILPEYVSIMNNSKYFVLENKFTIPNQKDRYQQIHIYRSVVDK